MLGLTLFECEGLVDSGSIPSCPYFHIVDKPLNYKGGVVWVEVGVGFVEVKGKHEGFDVWISLISVDFGEGRGVVNEGLGGGRNCFHFVHGDQSLNKQCSDSDKKDDRDDNAALIAVEGFFSNSPEVGVGEEIEGPKKVKHFCLFLKFMVCKFKLIVGKRTKIQIPNYN